MKTYQILADVHRAGVYLGRKEAVVSIPEEVQPSEEWVLRFFETLYGGVDVYASSAQWAELCELPWPAAQGCDDVKGDMLPERMTSTELAVREGIPSPTIHW